MHFDNISTALNVKAQCKKVLKARDKNNLESSEELPKECLWQSETLGIKEKRAA